MKYIIQVNTITYVLFSAQLNNASIWGYRAFMIFMQTIVCMSEILEELNCKLDHIK